MKRKEEKRSGKDGLRKESRKTKEKNTGQWHERKKLKEKERKKKEEENMKGMKIKKSEEKGRKRLGKD